MSDEFEKHWKGTESEKLLGELWKASHALWDKIEECIKHAKTLPEGFEKICFLNSVKGHIYSGIDEAIRFATMKGWSRSSGI